MVSGVESILEKNYTFRVKPYFNISNSTPLDAF